LKNNLSHSSVPKIVILAFIIVACIPFSSYIGDGTKQSRARVLAMRIQNFFLDNKRQEKILKNTRILVKRFRPFIKELSLVFSENMGH